MIVDFASPGPEERRLLWQSHLGAKHELSQRELNQLAANTSELCGGHIRNAVLTAATLSGADCGLRYEDVLEGLSVEFRKLGKQMPVELSKP